MQLILAGMGVFVLVDVCMGTFIRINASMFFPILEMSTPT
jgi:hypothetical protein